jgi:chemotaxis response regulator CheB
VLVQDPVEAIVPSMPEHAITEVGAAAEVLSATAIGEELARLGPAPDIEIRPLVEAPT